VYVDRSGRTITLHTEDNHLCEVLTTFSTGITALNGLTDQVQTFAVGTSGTDFAISSASATHTFNLPTASAANRGALSSTDWSTFNGKQDLISAGTGISIASNIVTNTAPDQTVVLTAGSGITVSGTYPSFTIASSGGSAPVIYKSTTDAGNYSGTTNTVVFTQAVPANTFAAGNIIRVNYRTRKTGTGGTQTLRIYVNTTANLSGTPILVGSFANAGAPSFLVGQMLRHLVIKSSTNNTEVYFAPGLGYFIDYNIYDLTTTAAINWTINQNFVFAIQNNNALDVNFGSMYLIERL
jgi:hypothetical protein